VSFLIDPVFSNTIGRVVPRHGAAGLRPDQLPPIAAILVTHNHYDHLDAPSIEALDRSLPVLAPLGLGGWFRKRGFREIHELGWWDRREAGPLGITFVPARHWSRRRLADINQSLWGGYVVHAGGRTLYHAGDTGWFGGFEEIARRYPSIDLALLPIGAYAPAWFMEPHHMNPEQALDAFTVMRAKAMVPMHWGAFQLTDEPLLEPIERLKRAWQARKPEGDLRILDVGGSTAI
jgi:L-ascorbate metabolism protein UlaG (beta-lactamase superfamily)